MSVTVIINPKTGLGEVENPYVGMSGFMSFDKENPPIPVITAAGETLTEGTWQCEKVWRHASGITWTDDGSGKYDDCRLNLTAFYRVIETPELPGKETTLDQHIAEMHTLIEGKEMVVDAAIRNLTVSKDSYLGQQYIGKFIAGANWQSSHSIDRDKVIEMFKWLLGYYDFPEPPKEGRPKYYWRTDLRKKLKEIGIEITDNQSPFQPNKKGNLHD